MKTLVFSLILILFLFSPVYAFVDVSPPTYGRITCNNQIYNSSVVFECVIIDNIANDMFIFSWNNSGVWENSTAQHSLPIYNSNTLILFSGIWANNGTVATKIYSNDTSNNWGVSAEYNFVLSSIANNNVLISTSTPTPNITQIPTQIESKQNTTIFITILAIIGLIVVVILGSNKKT